MTQVSFNSLMSAKYCIFGPLNLYLLSSYLCYFLMFLVSFSVLQVIERKLWFEGGTCEEVKSS
jgi:hypothetical protein